ncbi:MAG TPA: roadblock/LC7 domain-containing protein [Desulfuromonadaceae bacterium]|jgi:predicted regulator of Ras-like GTPase activity (Roadblock/LC7/MglB family)
MPFQSILKELVERTPQSIGAILVDWEGEAVQEYCHCDPYDIRFLAAHQGIILSRLKEIPDEVHGGQVEDIVITTNDNHLIIGTINQEYALAMSIGRSGPISLALHHFRNAIGRLKKEI